MTMHRGLLAFTLFRPRLLASTLTFARRHSSFQAGQGHQTSIYSCSFTRPLLVRKLSLLKIPAGFTHRNEANFCFNKAAAQLAPKICVPPVLIHKRVASEESHIPSSRSLRR